MYILHTSFCYDCTVFNLVGEVRHPHGDIGGQDDAPGDQDGQPRDRDRPQGDGGHGEHNRQEPGHFYLFSKFQKVIGST